MTWRVRNGLESDDPPSFGEPALPGPEIPRVLLVEDDALIGLDLEASLCLAGFEVVGPIGNPQQAASRAGAESIDVAVLDIDLHGVRDFSMADMLASRDIPFMFLSGHNHAIVPSQHAERPFLQRPCSFRAVAALLRLLVEMRTALSGSDRGRGLPPGGMPAARA